MVNEPRKVVHLGKYDFEPKSATVCGQTLGYLTKCQCSKRTQKRTPKPRRKFRDEIKTGKKGAV